MTTAYLLRHADVNRSKGFRFSFNLRTFHDYDILKLISCASLPLANEVWGKVMFLLMLVCSHGGLPLEGRLPLGGPASRGGSASRGVLPLKGVCL